MLDLSIYFNRMTVYANANQINSGNPEHVPVNVLINVTVPAIKFGVLKAVVAFVNL